MKTSKLVSFSCGIGCALAGSLFAAERPDPKNELPAEQVFKNIQVFQGTRSSQVIDAMRFMASSLGVFCDHCHVTTEKGNWPMERDDKESKKTARRMIRMVRAINQANFEGQTTVTCATCHQGHPVPVGIPPVPPLAAPGKESPAQGSAAAPPLPPAREVFEKYLSALGGREAIAAVKTREIEGELIGESGRHYPLQVLLSRDGYRETIEHTNGSEIFGFDGSVGWGAAGSHSWTLQGAEHGRIARAAELFPAQDLAVSAAEAKTTERVKTDGVDAFRVVVNRDQSTRVDLDFDVQSGFLLRRTVLSSSPLGLYPQETDYADYRAVDGVRVPFIVRRKEVNTRWTEVYRSIKQNVTIDPSVFARPPNERS